eukprot:scaffold207932_cov17-Tisochrysis_lutea.AAC.1
MVQWVLCSLHLPFPCPNWATFCTPGGTTPISSLSPSPPVTPNYTPDKVPYRRCWSAKLRGSSLTP